MKRNCDTCKLGMVDDADQCLDCYVTTTDTHYNWVKSEDAARVEMWRACGYTDEFIEEALGHSLEAFL